MGKYMSCDLIEERKLAKDSSVPDEYKKWWNGAIDEVLRYVPFAEVIPESWIQEWASKNDVHDERAVAKMMRDWGNENGGEV